LQPEQLFRLWQRFVYRYVLNTFSRVIAALQNTIFHVIWGKNTRQDKQSMLNLSSIAACRALPLSCCIAE